MDEIGTFKVVSLGPILLPPILDERLGAAPGAASIQMGNYGSMICPERQTARLRVAAAKCTRGAAPITRCARLLLLLIMLVGVVGVAAPTASLAASFLERAQQYFAEGDMNAAGIELKNALQRDANNAEARFLLGKIHLQLGDPASAEKEFLRARDLGHEDKDLDLLLAYAHLEQQRYRDVIDSIPEQGAVDSVVQQDLFVARGEALIGLGRFDEAEAVFDQVLQAGPHARALIGKAQVASTIGDQARARELIEEARAIASDEAFVILADAEWLLRERRFEEAKNAFVRAIELEPRQLRAHLGKLQSHSALQEVEEARKVLEYVKAAAPGNPAVELQEAIIELLVGNFGRAKTLADHVLSRWDNAPQALLVAGISAYELKEYEQARAQLTRYLSLRPDDHQARMVLGSTLLNLGASEQAYSTLKAAPGAIPDAGDYLAVLTNAAVETGDLKGASTYLEQLVVKKPDDADLRRRLAVARVATGDIQGGAAAYEEALGLAPDDLELYAHLFSVYMQLEDTAKALEVAQRVQSKFPSRSAGYTLSGIAYMASADRAAAKEVFEIAAEREPGNLEAAGNLAKLLLLDNEVDDARAVFDRALESNPGDLNTLVAYADMETSAGSSAKAEVLLRSALEHNPQAEAPRIKLGNIALRGGRPNETLQVTEPVMADGVQSIELLETVGLARFEVGDNKGALDAFEAMAAAASESPKAHEYRMLALERNGRIADALSAAERVLELDPTVTPARFGKVRYLAQLGRLDEAKAALQPLKEQFPEDVQILVVEGRIALAEGRFDAADEVLGRAFTLRRNNRMLVELVRAKMLAQRREEGVAIMQEWLREYPEDLFVRTTLADSYIKSGQFHDARDQLSTVIERAPNDPRSKVSMAQVLLELGSNEEAARYARQAYELNPGNPTVADTLGVSLLRSGQNQEALRILSAAREAAGDDQAIRLHFSEALAENGQKGRAITELQELLREEKDFPERAAAEKLLGTLQE